MILGDAEILVDRRTVRAVRPEKSGRAMAWGPNCRNEIATLFVPDRIGSASTVPRYF